MKQGWLAPHRPKGPLFANRFRVSHRIGEGGRAKIFAGQDTITGVPVVLKILDRNKRSARDLARFRAEIDTLVTIGPHPHIATPFFFDRNRAPYLYVMERAVGTFEGVIDSFSDMMLASPFWKQELITVVRQLCDGLSAVHGSGLIHRDIKPSNLLIDSTGRIRYADFDLAVPNGTRISPEEAEGTVVYIAPEQIPFNFSYSVVDHRSDIYSLGIILYELLTGHVPFTGDTVDVLQGHLFKPAPSLCTPISIPPLLDSLIKRMLAKDPDQRPQSVQEVLACVQEALKD